MTEIEGRLGETTVVEEGMEEELLSLVSLMRPSCLTLKRLRFSQDCSMEKLLAEIACLSLEEAEEVEEEVVVVVEEEGIYALSLFLRAVSSPPLNDGISMLSITNQNI